jgi:4-amino-4-deoxy-L-arabinose transferase-like glycosyltransferase
MSKQKGSLGNGIIAFLLACLTAVLLTVTAPAIGLTWDEPYYIAAADSYADWFGLLVRNPSQALQPTVIDQYWTVNHEHPPVEKIWSGLVWKVAHHFFDDLTANRLGAILLVALLVALLYLLIAPVYGKAAGLFAALALMSMPRFFFHAHLAALDVPVAVAAFGVTFIFWKTINRMEWWWGIVLGLAWGLAVAVKLNGVFVPISLVIWCMFFWRKWAAAGRFLLMGLTAIAVFLIAWPWLYHQTWARIVDYVNFQFHHDLTGQWFLGKFYLQAPWTFVWVILVAILPLTTLVLSFIGIARAGKGKKDGGLVWILIISALVSIAPFLFGRSPLYDDDRLFMPVYSFLAALAGIGFGWIIDRLRKLANLLKHPLLSHNIGLLLGLVLLLPQSITMAELYPHLLSYYSETVGGLRGATDLGLETTYWSETYKAALPYINSHAHPGDTLWAELTSYDVLVYYQIHGQLRKDVVILNDPYAADLFGSQAPKPAYGDISTADWIIFQYRQSQYGGPEQDYLPIQVLKDKKPVYELSLQGVPLMDLYSKNK